MRKLVSFPDVPPLYRWWLPAWYCLIFLSWLAIILPVNGTASQEQAETGVILYLLYTVPVALFSAMTLLVCAHKFRFVSAPGIWLLLFSLTAGAISLARADFASIRFLIGFCIPLFVIFEWRPTIPLPALNGLLFLSIPIIAVLRVVGLSDYGVIPGTSYDSDIWWRVALFQYVPETGFFSGCLIIMNMCRKDVPLRWPAILTSLYFLLLSGSRSALMVTALGLGFIFLGTRRIFRPTLNRSALFFLLLMAFCIPVFLGDFLVNVTSDNPIVNTFLTHSKDGVQSAEDAQKSVARLWIWQQHFDAFMQSPAIGIGTFDFKTVANDTKLLSQSGSEAFLTGLFARFGLLAMLCIAGFVSVANRAIRENNDVGAAMVLMALCTMLGYGSIVTTYDFAFLVMVGLSVSTQRNFYPEDAYDILPLKKDQVWGNWKALQHKELQPPPKAFRQMVLEK